MTTDRIGLHLVIVPLQTTENQVVDSISASEQEYVSNKGGEALSQTLICGTPRNSRSFSPLQ